MKIINHTADTNIKQKCYYLKLKGFKYLLWEQQQWHNILINRSKTTVDSPVEIGFRHTTSQGGSVNGMRSYRTDEDIPIEELETTLRLVRRLIKKFN